MTNAQHNDTLLETLRRNVSILGELAVRYGVETHPPRPADPPAVYSPEAVRLLLAPEMAHLAQEQFRVLLLDTKTRIVGQRVIYQGGRELHHRQTGRGVPARCHGGGAQDHRDPQPSLERPRTEPG